MTERAYIISIKPYRETSLLIDFLTENQGIVTVNAKGAKRPKSAFKESLQPYRLLDINLAGRGAIKILATIDVIEYNFNIGTDALICAMYANELMYSFKAHKFEAQDLFSSYHSFVVALNAQQDLLATLRNFELDLLATLGFGLQLRYEFLASKPIVAAQYYRYIFSEGLQACDDRVCAHTHCISGEILADIQQRNWHRKSLKAAKFLTQLALNFYLPNKVFTSRELIKSLYQLQKSE